MNTSSSDGGTGRIPWSADALRGQRAADCVDSRRRLDRAQAHVRPIPEHLHVVDARDGRQHVDRRPRGVGHHFQQQAGERRLQHRRLVERHEAAFVQQRHPAAPLRFVQVRAWPSRW